jgi:glycogen operon protein
MTEQDWTAGYAKSFMVFLNGEAIPSRGRRGERVVDTSLLVCLNAHVDAMAFTLPGPPLGEAWLKVIDTAQEVAPMAEEPTAAGTVVRLLARSLAVFERK